MHPIRQTNAQKYLYPVFDCSLNTRMVSGWCQYTAVRRI